MSKELKPFEDWNPRPSPWQSVSEGPPEVKEIVLVTDGVNTWQAELLLNRQFYCEETQHELHGITHWMPIPELPEGK